MFLPVALAEADVERVKGRRADTALASEKSVLNPSQTSDLRDLEIRKSILVAQRRLIENVHGSMKNAECKMVTAECL
jgi:hypothetical protein